MRCSGDIENVGRPIIMARNLIAGPTPNQEIHIVDKKIFEKKLRKLYQDGSENLEIITDFDWTFTRYKNNGARVCSTYQLLQNSVLTSKKSAYINTLYEFYHPIEIDQTIPAEIKEKHMQDWWEKCNHTLLEEGFNNSDTINFINNSSLYFRFGLPEFLIILKNQNIPITILSGGIGNLIETSLKQIHPENGIKIVSNFIEFDKLGKSSQFIQPEVRADKSKLLTGKKFRKNILLLGDLVSVFDN
ncbi:hypothetical protein SteCoe_285 [Stentor coeruleus]|uniref:5'-nucleotidase n=1 Tax=Stentor coeruleus TaxID=5963 RepID=A0A1R2D4G9_9CILI|nr:hypothetical protein SteCoe_285 [Stentor coeruleus]